MVSQVLQARLDTPIVFTADKDKAVGGFYLLAQILHCLWCSATWVFLVHSTQDRQPNLACVYELRIKLPRHQPGSHIPGQPYSKSWFAIGTIKNEYIFLAVHV